MFSFWKKKESKTSKHHPVESSRPEPIAPKQSDTPPLCPDNPGTEFDFRTATSGRGVDQINLVVLLAKVLKNAGHTIEPHLGRVVLDAWLTLQPRLVSLDATENGYSCCSTIDVSGAPTIAQAVFEYQHSAGNTLEESFLKGFEQWEKTDLPVLLDARRPKAETCLELRATFPGEAGQPERVRRAVMGPVMHYQERTPTAEEEHPFCNCCLLTQSMQAFKSYFESNQFVALRMFAARDRDGVTSADCRVNGVDFEEGKDALRAYAATWPEAGYEFRKQYVVLQNSVPYED